MLPEVVNVTKRVENMESNRNRMMREPVFLCILAVCTPFVSAKTINVADHGIVPGKDVTFEVNQLIASLKGENDVTLFFSKGQYDFYPENAVEAYRAVTNHDNSLKRMAFPLFGFEDFTLDGGGSTFMFHGRICPIVLDGAKGITLKNFSIDWDTPFHHELRVIERDPKTNSFIVEISPQKYGYEIKDDQILFNHYNWQDPIGQNITFDPATICEGTRLPWPMCLSGTDTEPRSSASGIWVTTIPSARWTVVLTSRSFTVAG